MSLPKEAHAFFDVTAAVRNHRARHANNMSGGFQLGVNGNSVATGQDCQLEYLHILMAEIESMPAHLMQTRAKYHQRLLLANGDGGVDNEDPVVGPGL